MRWYRAEPWCWPSTRVRRTATSRNSFSRLQAIAPALLHLLSNSEDASPATPSTPSTTTTTTTKLPRPRGCHGFYRDGKREMPARARYCSRAHHCIYRWIFHLSSLLYLSSTPSIIRSFIRVSAPQHTHTPHTSTISSLSPRQHQRLIVLSSSGVG